MATITKVPSRIHTAFNPVILQLSAESQYEIDNGIQCTLTSDSRSSTIEREFFNGLTRFDLSEILKYWFKEEVVILPQTAFCFLDKRLAFEYDIDLSGSTSTAVNAVVQLQRDPDMTTWGNRFLTNFPVIKKYAGYPLDISYLNVEQYALVVFDGDILNEGDPITDPHFSITIPDNVASVAISAFSQEVFLLTNSGTIIQANNSQNITVKGVDILEVQAEEDVLSSCTPGNPFYVRWINRMGGFDYRMFYENQSYALNVKNQATFIPVADDILNAGYTAREVSKEAERTVTVGAGNLTDIEYKELLTISTSPRVEVWDTESRKWYQVYVASGKFEYSSRDIRKEIAVELTLPSPQIQF
jgi:hypothetical protein